MARLVDVCCLLCFGAAWSASPCSSGVGCDSEEAALVQMKMDIRSPPGREELEKAVQLEKVKKAAPFVDPKPEDVGMLLMAVKKNLEEVYANTSSEIWTEILKVDKFANTTKAAVAAAQRETSKNLSDYINVVILREEFKVRRDLVAKVVHEWDTDITKRLLRGDLHDIKTNRSTLLSTAFTGVLNNSGDTTLKKWTEGNKTIMEGKDSLHALSLVRQASQEMVDAAVSFMFYWDLPNHNISWSHSSNDKILHENYQLLADDCDKHEKKFQELKGDMTEAQVYSAAQRYLNLLVQEESAKAQEMIVYNALKFYKGFKATQLKQTDEALLSWNRTKLPRTEELDTFFTGMVTEQIKLRNSLAFMKGMHKAHRQAALTLMATNTFDNEEGVQTTATPLFVLQKLRRAESEKKSYEAIMKPILKMQDSLTAPVDIVDAVTRLHAGMAVEPREHKKHDDPDMDW